ncbi:hypothetical protein AVEN_41127-1, partial [Araneus ventricosus]
RGRGRGNTNGRSYSHSSMELLTGRNYYSGSDEGLEVVENDVIYQSSTPPILNSSTAMPPQGVRKLDVVGKDNWTSYCAYLRSDLRTSPHL